MSGRTSHRLAASIAALKAVRSSGDQHATLNTAVRVAAQFLPAERQSQLPAPGARTAADIDQLTNSLLAELEAMRGATTDRDAIIMIVEDDRLTARVHADALAGVADSVLIAETGAQAEAMLREHDVSIALLDLVLPDSDGRDLLARIRASSATRSLPIIVITGRTDAVTKAECFALGADTVLAKPIDANVLAAAVGAHLDLAAQRHLEGRIDRLTGLPNRSALLDAFERVAPLSKRNRQPLCVAMIDLDFFKAVNDTHGHEMGDEVLRRTAHTLAQALRVSDLAARWGGEEFCVMLPDTSRAGAVRALQKALETVRQLVFKDNATSFGVTFSAGVASMEPQRPFMDIFKEADRLLYLAKHSGRNQVFSAADEADPPRPCVLLVEDDPGVARLITALLDREGFAVDHHADGQSALDQALQDHFVMAIVDLNVPLVDGFEVVERLRAIPACAKLPIVLLTGSGEEEDIVRGFEIGANDYMVKPFFARELAARVHRLLPRR